jgi:EAL domain-containing protein (putative c-di-GMP-specific phosphodiesterase class I)
MVYQPQVTMDGMNFKGVEALMRWTHPIYGDVTPINFIPILEETGLIEAYGIWGLKQSCAQFKEWLNMGVVPENSRVSVNLSPRQFRQKNLAESILDALSETGLPPSNLTLEITETMIMQRRGEAAEILETLRIEGISVAVDDFGTGYSSLAYLKTLPVDYLKIDREFIKDIVFNTDDQAIAASIIQLAHSLRLNVVAEGVETEDVQNTLLGMGCDQFQGYYFAKPMMPEEIPAVAERCR